MRELLHPVKNKLTMTVQHLESLYPDRSEWLSRCEQLRQASTLPDLVWMALQLGLLFARLAVEQELNNRSLELTNWEKCSGCQQQIRSKGFRPRQMETLIGCIH
jgi:hypothetical protein